MSQKPRRPVSDEEVLDWWEYYLEVRSVTATATHFNRFDASVRYHLRVLGVFEETPPIRKKITSDIDQMIERILEGDWTESETRVAAALRRIAYSEEAHCYPPHLPYADALPHVKRNTRHANPQSARQRGLDAMASGHWRHEIRAELAAAGLMTRVRPRGQMYFT